MACTIFLLNGTLLPWTDGSSSFGKGPKRLKLLQPSARSLLGSAIPAESRGWGLTLEARHSARKGISNPGVCVCRNRWQGL